MDLTYTNALIIQHCAVSGRLEQAVRAYHVGTPRLYTQGRLGLHVTFIPTGKRKMAYYSMTEDNLRYLTIEADGQVLYDSRADIPCDMAHWEATNARFHDNEQLARIRPA